MSFIPDSEITDNELLYRAIHPSHWNEEENKPSSALFKDKKGVSVDRDGGREEGEISQTLLSNRINYGLGKLSAREARDIEVLPKPDPLPENIFHALLLESESKIEITNSKARKLSKALHILQIPKLNDNN